MDQMRISASDIKKFEQERLNAPSWGGAVRVELCKDSTPHNSAT